MALSKKNLTILIVVLVIGGIAALKFFQSNGSFVLANPVEARTKGPNQAKLQIIEYIDFECPACAFGAEKLKEYMKLYPNDIHVEVKYYPLMNMHAHALQAASYVECVSRQGKFWPFFDAMMSSQAQWTRLINVEGVFDQLAQGAGVNMGQLKSCLSAEDVSVTIMSEKSAGRSMGVQSTPTYFINKKMVVGGKSLEEELQAYFKKSK
jgi:protein-disulfide isomerase